MPAHGTILSKGARRRFVIFGAPAPSACVDRSIKHRHTPPDNPPAWRRLRYTGDFAAQPPLSSMVLKAQLDVCPTLYDAIPDLYSLAAALIAAFCE
jgi:hypothetical protein